jgi:ABC-type branched-subunit amino acid transport system substrate-binding protein
MLKRSWMLSSLAISCITVLMFLAACKSSNKAVRIAGNLPLTGPVAAFSGQYPNGFRMGIDEASKELNVPASQFDVDFQDNAGTAATSVSVFQKQQLSSPDVYISGTSEAAIAIAQQVDRLQIPNFLVAFDPFLAREGQNRLRILPNSKIEAPLFIKYAKFRNAKKVFILNLNSAYANNEVDAIIGPGLNAAGIQYQRELYDFQLRDFKNLVLKAKAYRPDLTFVIGYSFHLKPLLRDLRASGMINDGSVMAAMDFVDMLYDQTPKEELQGVAFACPLFEVTGAIAGAEQWRSRYTQRFGRPPTYVEAYAYDTGQLIVKAFKENAKVNTQTLRASLPIKGITGQVNVDKDGDIVATITVARVQPDGSVREAITKE